MDADPPPKDDDGLAESAQASTSGETAGQQKTLQPEDFEALMKKMKDSGVSSDQIKMYFELGQQMCAEKVELQTNNRTIVTVNERSGAELDMSVPTDEYEDLGRLRSGNRNTVRLRKNKQTQAEVVAKLLPKCEKESRREAKALKAVQDGSGDFVSLITYKMEGKYLVLYMDIVPGFDLSSPTHLRRITRTKSESPSRRNLMQLFCLCVLHNLLTIIKKLHDIGYTHGDVHGGNFRFRKDKLKLVMLDFGSAEKLQSGKKADTFGALEGDYEGVLKVFCRMYIAQNFSDISQLQNELRTGHSQRVDQGKRTIPEIEQMPEEERRMLSQLIDNCVDICNIKSDEYGNPDSVLRFIEQTVYPEITGETAFRCFLQALREIRKFHLDEHLQDERQHHSPEAVIDKNKDMLLRSLTREEFNDTIQMMVNWGVLSDSQDDSLPPEIQHKQSDQEQSFWKLHKAVKSSRTTILRRENIPADVLDEIGEILTERKDQIKRDTVELLNAALPEQGPSEGAAAPTDREAVQIAETAGREEEMAQDEAESGRRRLPSQAMENSDMDVDIPTKMPPRDY